MSLNFTIASRNLFHDGLRFIATMLGVMFSVVLVLVQLGLYEGFGRMVTTMIDHTRADLWIMRKGTKCFEDPSLMNLADIDDAGNVDGVARVTPLLIGFSDWRLTNGEMTPVFIVGSMQHSLDPWNVVAGSSTSLSEQDGVAVDVTYKERLGLDGLGTKADIRGNSVRVVALTSGIRSFTTTPYVFANFDSARKYTGIPQTSTSYLLIKLVPGADRETARRNLLSKVPNVDVLTTAEFRERSRVFWLFGTGAGAALFAGAILGLVVGTVIVAQILYSSTKDHQFEFATLRAMGSSKRYIYSVILYQAALNAIIGFGLASIVGLGVVLFTSNGALPIVISPVIMIFIFLLTFAMCIVAALAAVLRVVRLDPLMALNR